MLVAHKLGPIFHGRASGVEARCASLAEPPEVFAAGRIEVKNLLGAAPIRADTPFCSIP